LKALSWGDKSEGNACQTVVADSTQGQAGVFGSILFLKLMLLTFSFSADDSESMESWLM